MNKLSEKVIKEINQLYDDELLTYKQIATKLNISYQTVRNHVKVSRKTKITVKLIQEFNRLYNEGLTLKVIAKRYNVTSGTINNYIWVHRKRGRRKLEDEWSAEELERMLG
ncbi:winged helix-turn-helix transcriptional regulator [Clostridium estertheticum]|uniref:helix-turn-helix transcriptional regulator n=1 Tax=Clostridium estertheticum TaxID=238834 RepID=UPI0013EE6988|nr:winged helix-turn-helix transcriptional regulator [Clostridium estertheticum]MBZ9608666.1 winged helix-turn-helix transcriptional regulator [Clostridium estertheticum]